ncbi:MAG TPA: hypothetical protein VIK38_11550, partial [Coriobacteriia bacterium]
MDHRKALEADPGRDRLHQGVDVLRPADGDTRSPEVRRVQAEPHAAGLDAPGIDRVEDPGQLVHAGAQSVAAS